MSERRDSNLGGASNGIPNIQEHGPGEQRTAAVAIPTLVLLQPPVTQAPITPYISPQGLLPVVVAGRAQSSSSHVLSTSSAWGPGPSTATVSPARMASRNRQYSTSRPAWAAQPKRVGPVHNSWQRGSQTNTRSLEDLDPELWAVARKSFGNMGRSEPNLQAPVRCMYTATTTEPATSRNDSSQVAATSAQSISSGGTSQESGMLSDAEAARILMSWRNPK